MVLELTQESFQKEVKESDLPVIVDFWASWCGPCKMLTPVFEEISSEYEGKLKFVKISTEEHPNVAGENMVTGIPCLIVFNKGEEVDRIIGFSPKEKLKEKIDAVLAKI
jgi:thioredoxin 1